LLRRQGSPFFFLPGCCLVPAARPAFFSRSHFHHDRVFLFFTRRGVFCVFSLDLFSGATGSFPSSWENCVPNAFGDRSRVLPFLSVGLQIPCSVDLPSNILRHYPAHSISSRKYDLLETFPFRASSHVHLLFQPFRRCVVVLISLSRNSDGLLLPPFNPFFMNQDRRPFSFSMPHIYIAFVFFVAFWFRARAEAYGHPSNAIAFFSGRTLNTAVRVRFSRRYFLFLFSDGCLGLFFSYAAEFFLC